MENQAQATPPTLNESTAARNLDAVGEAANTSHVPSKTLTNTSTVNRNEKIINTDGKDPYEWESKWPPMAKFGIHRDALLVGGIFFGTLAGIFLTWHGLSFEIMSYGCHGCSKATFNKYSYFFFGGMLGGTLFGLKYLYMVVARGYWTEDRWLWRVSTPFLSGGLALAFGAMLDSGIFGLSVAAKSNPSYLSIGFITGYFADSAIAKMQEIADTVFGKPSRHQQS